LIKHPEKAVLAVYGVAVGDALGFPIQFRPREERKRNPVIDMGRSQEEFLHSGLYVPNAVGLWSDDTSLTLCLTESLLNGFNLRDQAERFLAWHEIGHMSALNHAFDQGHQTVKALNQVKRILQSGEYEQLEHLANNDDEYSNGNGSLMRILPLILFIKEMDIVTQFKYVRKASALTHPHIRSALCCMYYLKMAEYIIDGIDKFSAYRTARSEILHLMDGFNCSENEYCALHRLLHIDIEKLDEDEIDSGGYVVSTLEASIWCLLTTDSFQDAVLKAVNLGDDTDTTGAITGGLAALLYGYDSIPKDWITKLKKPELFDSIISRYIEQSE
jgi:ADP-ribosyl-[dinitrogen reductase] hydrolase